MSLLHKIGHKSDVCRNKLNDEKVQVNLTEEDLCAVMTDVNMVESNPKECMTQFELPPTFAPVG